MTQEYHETYSLDEIKKLSIAERIFIVEDIWDSIASSNENYELNEAQKEELELRLQADSEIPENIKPWDEVKNELRSRL